MPIAVLQGEPQTPVKKEIRRRSHEVVINFRLSLLRSLNDFSYRFIRSHRQKHLTGIVLCLSLRLGTRYKVAPGNSKNVTSDPVSRMRIYLSAIVLVAPPRGAERSDIFAAGSRMVRCASYSC